MDDDVVRRWEGLNIDILSKIFDLVGYNDLIDNVSLVCDSWQLGCWNSLYWANKTYTYNKMLDLDVTRGALDRLWMPNDNVYVIKLMKSLRNILEGIDGLEQWRSSIKCLNIPEHVQVFDTHLIYISERTIGLESLVMCCPSRLTTRSGFAKAMRYWKNLKYLHLAKGICKDLYEMIEEIGKSCHALEKLTLNGGRTTLDEVNAISKNLSQLKTVKIEFAILKRDVVHTIFTNPLIGPEEIQFKHCHTEPWYGSGSFALKRRGNNQQRCLEDVNDAYSVHLLEDVDAYSLDYIRRWMNNEDNVDSGHDSDTIWYPEWDSEINMFPEWGV